MLQLAWQDEWVEVIGIAFANGITSSTPKHTTMRDSPALSECSSTACPVNIACMPSCLHLATPWRASRTYKRGLRTNQVSVLLVGFLNVCLSAMSAGM
jgi:hypothetical protein